MIIDETERGSEIGIHVSLSLPDCINIVQGSDLVFVHLEQVPYLIAALQKFYDGEGQ